LVRRTVCSNSNKWKAFLKLSMKMKKTRKTISSKMIVHRNHHTNSKWNNLNKRKKTTLEVLLDTLENSQANMLMLKFSNYLMLMAVENWLEKTFMNVQEQWDGLNSNVSKNLIPNNHIVQLMNSFLSLIPTMMVKLQKKSSCLWWSISNNALQHLSLT